MGQLFAKLTRSTRLPGLLHTLVCAAALASGLPSLPVSAATITNTASATFTVAGASSPTALSSNTTSLSSLPPPTPSVATFYQYAPGVTGSASIAFDGGSSDTGGGVFVPLPAPTTLSGAPISLAAPVPVLPTTLYHAGEPVFITLADGNRNTDASVREYVVITVTSSTGDSETLKLQETGADTGVFSAVIRSVGSGSPVAAGNGVLSVAPDSTLTIHYTDALYPFDTSNTRARVDPYGFVFDSASGVPVNGVSVTLIDAGSGAPAQVFGDDGVSTFPATVVTGGTVQDSAGTVYTMPAGGFRFPYVNPGSYRYLVTPVAGYVVPSTVPVANMPRDPNGNAYAVGTGSFEDVFTVVPGPALHIDIPVDPQSKGLSLQKTVSQPMGSAGDFLQYQLSLRNLDSALPANKVTITDRLPMGLRYQHGSLRLGATVLPEPAISADGRTLTFGVGTLAPSAVAAIHYVVSIGAGAAVGQAVNSAQASAVVGGANAPVASNTASVAVNIQPPFFSGAATVVGRVFEGDCNTPFAKLKGVANVRVMMEDGSYAVTDRDGQYHFEGVTPGTHVVQMDVDSLPGDREAVACMSNTRFAGRNFSQFVEVQGGSLWRADFFTRQRKASLRDAEIGIRMTGSAGEVAPGFTHRIDLDGDAPVDKLATMVVLPQGLHYVPGSTRVDGVPAGDPELADGVATFRLGAVADPEWKRAVEFGVAPDSAGATTSARTEHSTYRLNARFGSCSADFDAGTAEAIRRLAAELHGTSIERIEVVGNTDNQRLAHDCRARFGDNKALSLARATEVGRAVAAQLGLKAAQVVARGDGADHPVASNRTAAGMALNRRTEVLVYGQKTSLVDAAGEGAAAAPAASSPAVYDIKALATFETAPQKRAQTPAVSNRLVASAASPVQPESARESIKVQVATDAARAEQRQQQAREQDFRARHGTRAAIVDDATAGGGKTDWLKDQGPGIAWLFPGEGHNPRSPGVRIVIKHAPGQVVELRRGNGERVDPLDFDGTMSNAEKTVAVSIWRGVAIKDGANEFVADIRDAQGNLVQRVTHTVMFANSPVRAEIVASESDLVADGISRPVLAIRLLDRDGHPVRAGYTGPVDIAAPYEAWQQADEEQKRQLSGMDRFRPQYQVEGDDGIAYIDLAPTSVSGAVNVNLTFQTGADTSRTQQLQAWINPGVRKWVVVGFAEGSAGYTTLKSHMQPADAVAAGAQDGSHGSDQASLYAKGTVLGKWLLTLAYDTRKASHDGANGLSPVIGSAIDPNRYYTLYGDGTSNRYDASSQHKLYLKLERGQFYALFGDYTTGMTRTRLSAYNRTLSGLKVESAGGDVSYVMFAADTPQDYARDEIQGDGTSGLYHLSHGGIVLNSEKIVMETRDRLHSETILQSQQMVPHVDYEIDYDNGTIFFKQPVPSRDQDFNPVFIVAQYETLGVAGRELDAGGRASVKLAGGKVEVGASAVHDEQNFVVTRLAGVDVKVKLPGDAEVRVEAAQTNASPATASPAGGDAWLAEYERHDGKNDTLLYTRKEDAGFGVKQQNAAETGMQKTGIDEQYRLDPHWSLQGRAWMQDNTTTSDQRDALSGKVQYKTGQGGFSVGAQSVTDKAGSSLAGGVAGQDYTSQQATLAGNRFFMNRKLELTGEVDSALGGQSNSIDFPDRYVLGAGYSLTDNTRLVAAQELTDGGSFSTSTSRVGVQVTPWKGAHLDSTMNQTQMSENGPRTFGELGLHQGWVVNKQWAMDLSTDSSHTFNRSGAQAPVIQTNMPVASGGTLSAAPALTENYNAVSVGATYRDTLWSWTGRGETRHGETRDRNGVFSGFLRQAEAGVAFASTAQLFISDDHVTRTNGTLFSADVAAAWRPLGTQWSVLDRLEFRYNSVSNGTGVPGSGVFGNNSLVTVGNADTRHFINNLAMNHVSREWTGEDQTGNLFTRYERSQWTLYYGSKYASDNFDGRNYSGYTDLLGLEARHDMTPVVDLGMQLSALNGWATHTHAYSFGPAVGYTPLPNGWITLGYNFRGFQDRDFDAARYTAQGIYLQLRIKFDQNTRFGHVDAVAADTAAQTEGQGVRP